MKTFLEDNEIATTTLNEFLQLHRKYVIDHLEEVDKEVEGQKTRIYKFCCWLKYGHLLKNDNNTCKRCGKVVEQK